MMWKQWTIVASAAVLSGCGGLTAIHKRTDAVNADYRDTEQLAQLQQKQRSTTRQTVKLRNDFWVATKPIAAVKPEQRLDCNITFSPNVPVDVTEFSQIISRVCRYPVSVTPDALAYLSGSMGASSSASAAGGSSPVPPLPSSGAASGPAAAPMSALIDTRWQGPATGLLDTVTARLGLSWKFDGKSVKIFFVETRTFPFHAITSKTTMKSDISSGSEGSAGGSGGASSGSTSGKSGQTTSVSIETSQAEDIKNTLQIMVTPGVGRIALSPSTGSITVTDTPVALARIGQYLEAENKQLTRQVVLNVRVLEVAIDDKDTYGIDWNIVQKNSKGFLSFKGGAGLPSDFDATQNSIQIVSTNSLSNAQALNAAMPGAVADPSGKSGVPGPSALIAALSSAGKVSVVTSPSVTTLNLQPVPVQVGTQQSYLARSSTTVNDGVQTTTLEPGTINTGFNMNLLPHVLHDKTLLLQFSVNLSTLIQIRQFGKEDGDQLQLPEIDNRIFSQRVRMNSGETLVLSGFEQRATRAEQRGRGSAKNFLLGGSMDSSDKKTVLVILITPVVMD